MQPTASSPSWSKEVWGVPLCADAAHGRTRFAGFRCAEPMAHFNTVNYSRVAVFGHSSERGLAICQRLPHRTMQQGGAGEFLCS
eukprot:gene48555-63820_t